MRRILSTRGPLADKDGQPNLPPRRWATFSSAAASTSCLIEELCHEALTSLLTAQVTGNIEQVARAKKNLDVIFVALELTDDLKAEVTARKLAGKV